MVIEVILYPSLSHKENTISLNSETQDVSDNTPSLSEHEFIDLAKYHFVTTEFCLV